MSLFTWSCGLFAVKPSVWTERDKLYARASIALRTASLGAYDRCVVADKQAKVISIYHKEWWTWRPEVTIPFARVVEIDRSFHRWTTKRVPDAYDARGWSRTDQVEFFK